MTRLIHIHHQGVVQLMGFQQNIDKGANAKNTEHKFSVCVYV